MSVLGVQGAGVSLEGRKIYNGFKWSQIQSKKLLKLDCSRWWWGWFKKTWWWVEILISLQYMSDFFRDF